MSGIEPNVLRARHRDLEVVVGDGLDPASRELRIEVEAEHAGTLLGRLYEGEEAAARRLVDLTAIDRGEGPAADAPPSARPSRRFEVVYRLHSAERQASLRVHARVQQDDTQIESVTSIWPAAIWLEREVFDLFGIVFKGHPDLRRLLLGPDFDGAPLRKDHPLQGTTGPVAGGRR